MTEPTQDVTLVCVHNCQEGQEGQMTLWLVPGREPRFGFYDVVAREGTRVLGPASPELVSQVFTSLSQGLRRLGLRVMADEIADD